VFTAKRQKMGMAGTYGEGFKAASLVMVWQGYQIRFEVSKFYWNFRFAGAEKDTLCCFFSTPKNSTLQKKAAKRSSTELKASLWEDVFVKIGKLNTSLGKKSRVG
jgi:hypothetical protein